jgi:O-acetyl-ADP-ribose deacetylase
VGPVWQGGKVNEPQILESCYCHCMEEATRLHCDTISFPSISTGAFGYPVAEAAQIALRSVADHLHKQTSLRMVRFVLFDAHTHSTYERAAENLANAFPHYEIRTDAKP